MLIEPTGVINTATRAVPSPLSTTTHRHSRATGTRQRMGSVRQLWLGSRKGDGRSHTS